MQRRRLLWHLYPSYLIITLVFLAAVTWLSSGWLKDFYLDKALKDQKANTALVRELVSERISTTSREGLEELALRLGEESGMRVTLILPDGQVIADSNEDPADMENHADRPEFISAISEGSGSATRRSPTLGREMVYYAVPVTREGSVAGVVRTAVFKGEYEKALGTLYRYMALGGLAIAVVVALLGFSASRRVGAVLSELEKGAQRFASGDLRGRLPVPEYEEMARLTESMNRMAAELDGRIRTITRQRNEQEAILSSMVEGVLAVDNRGRVMDMNASAARLLKADAEAARGRSVQEAVRSTELAAFVEAVLESGVPSEREIVIHANEDAILLVNGAPMQDETGGRLGVAVVLSDVTQLKRLELVRRDFVANVSHELRTPITSIMGFAELLSGGLEDKEEAARYADIIKKQSERLSEIIDDLMSLSVIEKRAESREIKLEPDALSGVLESAVQACSFRAGEKSMEVSLSCSEGVRAMINAKLLEQAVVNLIDNAIKYSEAGSRVEVSCREEGGWAVIDVHDNGAGIEEKHFPRLFERFYRVDKARSKKAGGTGLGLAIVKHIVQAHGGEVDVKSYPGRGSTFTVRLRRLHAENTPS